MIYISSDHKGFNLKNYLVNELTSKGVEIQDLGPIEYIEDDDYSDYAANLVLQMQEKPEDRGILICGSGVGVSIVANKFSGIRAALSWTQKQAVASRNDDDSNVLALPSDFITKEDALDIVQVWLTTPFSGEERHTRRLNKIAALEK